MDRQSQPILTIKSKNGGGRKDDLREGNKVEENPPVKLENSVSLNNLENKLAHLEKLQTCSGGKLNKRNKDLFSNIHRRTKSANAHFKGWKLERKKERKKERTFYETLKYSKGADKNKRRNSLVKVYN